MKYNKIISKNKQKANYAEKIVNGIVAEIQLVLSDSIIKVERQKYLNRNLNKYAYIFHLLNFEDFFHSQLGTIPQTATFSQDQQPKSIQIDNLCRPSLQKSLDKVSLLSIIQSRISQKSTSSSVKTNLLGKYKSQSLKLKLQPIEEVKTIAEMRQFKIDQQNEIVRKIQDEQQEKKRLVKKQKLNIDVSFDYNGQKLLKNTKVQYYLVQKLLNLKIKNPVITRKNQQPPQPQTVQGLKIEKKRQKKNKNNEAASQFTEFLDNQSLAENVQINQGIRYSHNSLIFEEKKVNIQPQELKSNLGKRRLSKSQFLKVSQLVDKKRDLRLKKFKTEQQSQNGFLHKRAYSETNLNSSRFRRRQVISIINPQLRQSMLIRLSDYQPFLVIQKEFPHQKCEQSTQQDRLDEQFSLMSFVKNDDTHSRVTEAVSEIPKLPEIKARGIPQVREEDLVITKLGRQLRSKM